MNNILISADGRVAKAFIKRVTNKALSNLHYNILVKDEKEIPKENKNAEYIVLDPTSKFRLQNICSKYNFLAVFIVMQNMQEAKEVYQNIRYIDKKIKVVALDLDGSFRDLEDSYLNILDAIELLSNRLYDYLPNAPVTAQTIGLNEGEIMEVMVPFASTFAFRHINSIPQIKWKIAAIYRDNKFLLPTNATMIRPRDRLLLVGKPQVLLNVYNKIKNKNENFPEPYGKNFYLFIDIDKDKDEAYNYIQESIYLLDRFNNKTLIIRVANPNNLDLVNRIKKLEKDRVKIYFSYDNIVEGTIAIDLEKHNIGLILISNKTLTTNEYSKKLHAYKKLIYIFGKTKFKNIKKAVVVKGDYKETEEISAVAFYIAEVLKIDLSLGDYNVNGNFEDSKMIVEHFETLAHVHNTKIKIIQERKNPIQALKKGQNTLLIIPFKESITSNKYLALLKRDINSLLLRANKHPKLLIPIAD